MFSLIPLQTFSRDDVFVDGKVTKSRGYISVKTCEGFLCFVAIVRVRVYCVASLFFVLRHW